MSRTWQSIRTALQPRWPVLAAVLVLFGYNAPLLTLRDIAPGHDTVLQYYPAERALARALAAGTLPFWTPHLQAGFPLFAQGQPAALYPINLLAFGLLPTPLAHSITLAVHQLLGLLFMIWWGRMLGISTGGAAWMGLAFALVPPLSGEDVLLIETVTWVPLLLGLAERCAQRGRLSWAVVPMTAMQWLGGFPQLALYTALATHIYLGVRVCAEDWPWSKRARLLAAWGGATAAGMLLAAPQLLPVYELSRFSIRAAGAPGSLPGEKSLFPAGILTLVLPSWRGFLFYAGLGIGTYIGMLPCVLAVATIAARPRRAWFYALLAVTAATLVFALGKYSPLFPVLRRLPGFAYFRIPSRSLFITQVGLITFFGLGWDVFVSAEQGVWTRALRWTFFGTLTLLLLNACVARPLFMWLHPYLLQFAERYTLRYVTPDPLHVQPFSYYQEKIEALYDMVINAASVRRREVVLPLSVGVVGALTWWWASAGIQRRRRVAMLWGGLILVDLLGATGWHRQTTEHSWISGAPDVVRLLTHEIGSQPCRMFWITDPELIAFEENRLVTLQANYNLMFDLSSVGIYAPLGFDAYSRLMEHLGGVDLGVGMRPVSIDDVMHDRALLNLLNVCYVLSRQPLPELTAVAQVGTVRVYRNEQAFPRAFAVDRTEVVDSTEAALRWVQSHFDRLRDTVALDEPSPVSLRAGAASHAWVSIADYGDTTVAIDVSASDSVLLVVSDTYYPGWQASVDGRPTHLYRADALFRAVVVPGGTHRVEFRYTPIAFRYGVAVAIAVGMLAGALITLRRRQNEPPE